MRKSSQILVLILLLITAFSCKQNKHQVEGVPFSNPTEQEANLYKNIIDVHDEVMPKMSEIADLKAKLKIEKEMIPVSESDPKRSAINAHLSELNKGEEGMFTWMNNFAAINDLPREEILPFLIKEESQVQVMADQINASIASAQEFLKPGM